MKKPKKRIFLLGFNEEQKKKLFKKIGKKYFLHSIKDINNATALVSYDRKSFDNIFKTILIDKNLSFDWIALPGVGIDKYVKLKKYKKTIFTNAKNTNSIQVADHALALLLAITRKTSFLSKYGVEAKFDFQPIELNNKRALIIGYGNIGKNIAKRAISFGLKVDILTNKIIAKGDFSNSYLFKDFYKIIHKPKIIFIASPLTRKTKNLFCSKTFNLIKQKPIIINVSRGEIISTEDLIRSLNMNIIQAAALDVTSPEPLPLNNELYKMSNVIITPHIASISKEYSKRYFSLIERNITQYLNDIELTNVVDLNRGY